MPPRLRGQLFALLAVIFLAASALLMMVESRRRVSLEVETAVLLVGVACVIAFLASNASEWG
jgi:hypothetical protein